MQAVLTVCMYYLYVVLVPGETRQSMASLSLPNSSIQELLRRDSSTQVDIDETVPSPTQSRSDIGIQAELPEKDLVRTIGKSHTNCWLITNNIHGFQIR